MKIRNVVIHNFRSIIDATFMMKDYMLVIGANNSGKSAVVDAIRAFYEVDKESKFITDRDVPKAGSEDKDSWIEITYELSEEEDASLKEEYRTKDRLLTLHKCLTGDKTKAGYIFNKGVDGKISDTPFYGAKNVQDGKIGDVIYIPAISKVDDQTKLSGPSALRDLVVKILEGVVEDSEPYQLLTGQVDAFASQVSKLETDDHRSLAGFEKRFNESLDAWGTRFALKFNTPSPSEMVKNMVSWSLKDDALKVEQTVDRYGSGFQRYFIYSLIKLSAQFLPKKKKTKAKDFCPNFTLLLFEEPEAFLHPQQQDELSRSLKNISGNDTWQVMCTSHSSHFVSHNMEDLTSIVRMRKEATVSKAYQISDATLNELLTASFDKTKYPLLFTKYKASSADMEGIKFAIWMNPARAGVFFAEKVLLSEGPTEVAIINKWVDEAKLELPPGSSVIDCFGKFNIFRFMMLMGALGIKHSVVRDKDTSAEHEEWNKLIEDSKNSFTDQIAEMDPDIEGEIGAEPTKEKHAKPQKLLWQYVNGKLNPDKVEAVVAKIKALF